MSVGARLDFSLHADSMLAATIPDVNAPVTQELYLILVQRIAVLMADARAGRCDITTHPRDWNTRIDPAWLFES